MKIGCCYQTFPGGEIIRSHYDTENQTVDGVPADIIKLNKDPAVKQYMETGELTHPTELTWRNIMATFGEFPEANLVLGNSMYHTIAITKGASFAYAFRNGEILDKKMFTLEDKSNAPILFPQEHHSIGLVKTFPKYYDWYQPTAMLNVFVYNGNWCYMRNGKIIKFPTEFDEKPDYGSINQMVLARTKEEVYAMYQINKVVTELI